MGLGHSGWPLPAPRPTLRHSLVHGVHQGGDLGLPSVAQLLTGLPEAEVLSWGSGHGVRPTPGWWKPGVGGARAGSRGGGFSPLNSFLRKSMKWARPTGSSKSSRKLKAHCSTRSLVGTAALGEGRVGQEHEEGRGTPAAPGPPQAHLGAFMAQ